MYIPAPMTRPLSSLIKLVTRTWLAMVAPNLAAVMAMERHIRASLCEPETLFQKPVTDNNF